MHAALLRVQSLHGACFALIRSGLLGAWSLATPQLKMAHACCILWQVVGPVVGAIYGGRLP